MNEIIAKFRRELERGKLKIKVKPEKNKFSVEEIEGKFTINLKSSPEKNKANDELVKELSKLIGKKIRIVSGFKSREKIVELNL